MLTPCTDWTHEGESWGARAIPFAAADHSGWRARKTTALDLVSPPAGERSMIRGVRTPPRPVDFEQFKRNKEVAQAILGWLEGDPEPDEDTQAVEGLLDSVRCDFD